MKFFANFLAEHSKESVLIEEEPTEGELLNSAIDARFKSEKFFMYPVPNRYTRLVPFRQAKLASYLASKSEMFSYQVNLSIEHFFFRNPELVKKFQGSQEAREIAENKDFAFNFVRLAIEQNFYSMMLNKELFCSMTGDFNRLCLKVIGNDYKNLMF